MAQSTIVTRIALDGAQDILKQLADLGQAGERAVKQIQDATSGANPALSGHSAVTATVRDAFTRVGETLAPVKQRFEELGTAVLAGTSLFPQRQAIDISATS